MNEKIKTSADYAQSLKIMFETSAESILLIGNIFVEAKSELSRDEYQKFLSLTKYANQSASVRKWLKIGEAYIRLKPIVDLLPPNWSTIYKIATLRASQLDILISENILHRDITAKEIDAELHPKFMKQEIGVFLEFDSTIDADSFQRDFGIVSKSLPANLCEIKLSKDAKLLLKSRICSANTLPNAA